MLNHGASADAFVPLLDYFGSALWWFLVKISIAWTIDIVVLKIEPHKYTILHNGNHPAPTLPYHATTRDRGGSTLYSAVKFIPGPSPCLHPSGE